jgi:hypothetical protein
MYATVLIFSTALLFVVICHRFVGSKKSFTLTKILFSLVCALPLIWQIDASLIRRLFASGLGGYSLIQN